MRIAESHKVAVLGFVSLFVVLMTAATVARPASAETLGSWTSTTPWNNSVAVGITGESCATASGYIYCVGGFRVGGPLSGVYYAPVSSSGVGTWASTTSYPTGFYQGSCTISGGYIYCVGGQIDNAGDFTNAVYYAPVSSSGVGAWTSSTAYPNIIDQESCASSGGYIYCVGGTADESNPYTPSNGVEFAQVSASGVGAWQTSNYPDVIRGQSCAISSGYIYCVGGDDAVDPYTDLVLFASVSSEGVGAWTASTHYPTDITEQSCGISSGYVYCVGGFIDGSSFTNAVYYSPVSSSGVGAWTSTTNYPSQIYSESCATYSGYIYCVGGQNSGGFIQSGVYYASVGGSLTSTTTSVSCLPGTVPIAGVSTCTATVTGSSPTGTITWTQSIPGTVTFGSGGTCTLTAGSCSVTASGVVDNSITVTGTYSGDGSNSGSFGTGPLTVGSVATPSPSPPPPLPPVSPMHITVDFNFPGSSPLTGNLVGLYGVGILYNVPGLTSSDVFPYVLSFCSLPGQNIIRITGFGQAGPGNNSTEIWVSNWSSVLTSATGWPTEPAC